MFLTKKEQEMCDGEYGENNNKNVKITLNTYDGKLEEKILYDDTE